MKAITKKKTMNIYRTVLQRIHHHHQTKAPTAFEITLFMRQFATLLTAGIPIVTACQLLEKSQSRQAMRLMIVALRQSLLSGQSLHQSMHAHTAPFNAFTRSLVQMGEHTGTLPAQLERIADYQEKQHALVRNIRQALFYPSLILAVAALVTTALFLFVIPRFAALFEDTHVTLPWITRCLFTVSRWLRFSV